MAATYASCSISSAALPFFQQRRIPLQPPPSFSSASPFNNTGGRTLIPQCLNGKKRFSLKFSNKQRFSSIPTRSTNDDDIDTSNQTKKAPFGYSRKDVILIGVGVTFLGIALKSGLEFAGVDPLQAGNVVQLVLVLGLTVGWISTYIFRVSNKEMTYAQQLRDYESKVMEKRLESLTEAELQVLLQEVEEEKSR
ncbi:hypothetical protein TSUD_72740 [Trifolium subterraneum]|uniref:Uncharacterized protein n=1 Tax=Trifolium subterraneum TaxID=3900 RepID=A0A2Z6LKQ0_TRISU|nr:hypothetical protein TSUD_72740 [Trifolium subterraneum]